MIKIITIKKWNQMLADLKEVRGIKIITTKKWNQMLADLEEVRGANVGLHELMKGQYNKYGIELAAKDDAIKELEAKVSSLESKLRKAEHKNNELTKKVRKYESRRE